jgi:hypothetical protein
MRSSPVGTIEALPEQHAPHRTRMNCAPTRDVILKADRPKDLARSSAPCLPERSEAKPNAVEGTCVCPRCRMGIHNLRSCHSDQREESAFRRQRQEQGCPILVAPLATRVGHATPNPCHPDPERSEGGTAMRGQTGRFPILRRRLAIWRQSVTASPSAKSPTSRKRREKWGTLLILKPEARRLTPEVRSLRSEV